MQMMDNKMVIGDRIDGLCQKWSRCSPILFFWAPERKSMSSLPLHLTQDHVSARYAIQLVLKSMRKHLHLWLLELNRPAVLFIIKLPGHSGLNSLEAKVIHLTDISAKIATLKEINSQTSATAQRAVLPNDNFGKIGKRCLIAGPREGKTILAP